MYRLVYIWIKVTFTECISRYVKNNIAIGKVGGRRIGDTMIV